MDSDGEYYEPQPAAWATVIGIGALIWLLAAIGLWSLMTGRAFAHDIYQGVRSPAGQLCCGGDPVTGDCEGAWDFKVGPDGAVTFFSERYKATIVVPGEQVIPTQLADPLNRPLHWCGRPDPSERSGFRTICMFLSPGGA